MSSAAHPRRHRITGLAVAVAGGCLALVATGGPVAAAATDGAPQLFYTTPQVARTAGGTPVRIFGSGFLGTTSVTFGGRPALDLKVVDTHLITATAPSGPNNTSVAIEITDNQGTGGSCEQSDPPKAPGCTDFDAAIGLFYTDATITVTPSTGLYSKAPITVSVRNYVPNANAVVVEMNPLIGFLEGGPDFRSSGYPGPPPYVVPIEGLINPSPTDANGNLDQPTKLDNYYTFNTFGYSYDHNAQCAPTQQSANFGLWQCMIGYSQFAVGTLERHVTFAPNPVPAPPTLGLSVATAKPGATVRLSGVRWTNNPWFGSDTTPNDPGETRLVVEICKSTGANCLAVTAHATVTLTRYKTTSTTTPIMGVFTGARLAGSFVVSNTAGCAPKCLIRVRQEGYDYDSYTGHGTGTFISATKALAIG